MATITALPLRRQVVAADNNCLFTSCAYLCEDIDSPTELRAAARRLRSACAATVLEDDDPETLAVILGFESVQAYSEWIVDETHWGGEPELLMLAKHYGVEVALASCETLRVTRYPIANAHGLIFLLYTGQHYDPLTGGAASMTRVLPQKASEETIAAWDACAIAIAEEHNAEVARKKLQRRVKRLKCGGCGAILDNSAAFQVHCSEVEHADDFMYDCDEVEIVLSAGDELPASSIDLESSEVHPFYNVSSPSRLSLSIACTLCPFELTGVVYDSMESYWRSDALTNVSLSERGPLLLAALRAQYTSAQAVESGLFDHLLSTGEKLLACVDLDPWLGVQAAGGISTGENHLGKALMSLRSELQEGTPAPAA